jgi:glutamyl endopeptidase
VAKKIPKKAAGKPAKATHSIARVKAKVDRKKSTAASSATGKSTKKTTVKKPIAPKKRFRPVSGDVSGQTLNTGVLPLFNRPAKRKLGILPDGHDDRTPIRPDTSGNYLAPYNLLCQLVITFPGGQEVGTGWFGGPGTLFTAGHCVYSRKLRGKALSISVWLPSTNKYIWATAWGSTHEWLSAGSEVADFGFVKIPVRSPSFFRYGDFAADQLRSKQIYIIGYPNDNSQQVNGPALWGQAGHLDVVKPRQLFYKVDTGGGQSGSPVFCWDDKSGLPVAVGIHNYGSEAMNTNYATRITAEIVKQLNSWNV